ncbi:type II secretion system protein J [Hydrogenophaga sp.]|uniref:PulJ/GspJ family protein n=1 Tax=Hydrogenophaga sp. TaxID=1904254 RepID=UPI00272F4F5A|nr:prepilin-type N-terminal cleavage/methylation domain-containing protein [Hydrogenophaga sp.]MDP2017735.1 prepilin-type N-terminal cleavage/methylation domain-containing protein [Hydrogenophaga sp.]MDP3811840.1 prepilin-type N-terminal cleavage/methylation domain-containing protein [Hydrogenophaga sp.]
MRRAHGFTLIELLVAIAVMAMLALLSWRSIDGMTRTQTFTQERSDGLLRLQSAVGQWVADLDAVLDTGEVTPVDFNGQTLRITRRDSTETGLDSRGVRVVAWAMQPTAAGRQWSRWQSGPLLQRDELARAWQRAADWGRGAGSSTPNAPATAVAAGADSSLALIAIDQWQVFYHRGETWGNPLSSVGTEVVGVSSMPNGVRLQLTLTSGRPLTGELLRDWVRPTLEAGR